MEKIKVLSSNKYDVLIGRGLLENCAEYIRTLTKCKKAAVITDKTVDALYSEKVLSSLKNNNFEAFKFVFDGGEENKNLSTVSDILSFLAKNEFTRSDIIIALGGGIVGDVAGFCASCYLRGIKFINIPTTLLACVDSSVGGKTGVNLPEGKNLAGAFHQPSLVICDPNVFSSLPEDTFADGISESIKCAIITDKKLFEEFKICNINEHIEEIIKRCVEIKADIVSRDEFDTGERQKLNLGHTVGHAIEKCSNFKISHGHAVAIGMVYASRAAHKLGLCDNIEEEICSVLEKYSLPTSCKFGADELISFMLRDKKRNSDKINLILPTEIGNTIIKETDIDTLKSIIFEG